MIYLDTGCFVKLYYPEPDSAKVVALIQGKPICHTLLHELEFMNALQLKVFFGSATDAQVTAASALVEADLKAGVLVSPGSEWKDVFSEAVKLAEQHTGVIGCRSLDILHCAAAKVLAAMPASTAAVISCVTGRTVNRKRSTFTLSPPLSEAEAKAPVLLHQ